MKNPNIERGSWPLSLVSGIRSAMYRNPEKIAVSDASGARNYRQLIDRIDRISQGFITDLKLSNTDQAAIIAGNCIEYVEIVGGASQAGVALATVNPRLSTAEISSICDDAEARVVFVDSENAERVRNCHFNTVDQIIEIGPQLDNWISSAKPITSSVLIPERDIFTLPYTSGTTGRPKGVMVSHRSRILTIYGMAAEYGCFSPDDRFLAIAPMCHGAGMVFALAAIYFGGYTKLTNQFDPEKVLRSLRDDHMSGVFMVPTHFHSIFSLENRVLADYEKIELQSIISNAAALPQPVKEQIVDYFGEGMLHESYGSTEASIVSNLRPKDQLLKQKCVGLPFNSTQVKIINDEGRECKADEVGELYSCSPFLFSGYWKNEAETKAAFDQGWITVGDLARRDSDGYLYIVDRKKDMVISGGINIYPREIEDVLAQHDAISEAGVIGIPDEKWGEKLKAYVVVTKGKRFDPSDAIAHCENLLAKYKIPSEFEILDELPRNANGKLVKAGLRQLAD